MNDGLPHSQSISVLDELISNVELMGFGETVALLKIARLDLIIRIHSISENEFNYALGAVQKNLAMTPQGSGGKKRSQSARLAGRC